MDPIYFMVQDILEWIGAKVDFIDSRSRVHWEV